MFSRFPLRCMETIYISSEFPKGGRPNLDGPVEAPVSRVGFGNSSSTLK